MPATLTQDDGSEADARTEATQRDVLGVISSPLRTITFPRGIRVKTLSTAPDASDRRRVVSAAFRVRLGRSAAARKAATSARSEAPSGPSESRVETSALTSDPYSRAAGAFLWRCSRPVEVSRTTTPPFCSSVELAVVHDSVGVELAPDRGQPVFDLGRKAQAGEGRKRLVADRKVEGVANLLRDLAA